MACQKCIDQGKQKTIHFTRCGRWETRIYCKHSYARAKLNKQETGYVLSKHEASKQKSLRRKTPAWSRIYHYSTEMDDFILATYNPKGRLFRGQGTMRKMVEAFDEKFGRKGTRPNQLIGRYHRLQRWALLDKSEALKPVGERHTPSLPVLKFMQFDGSGV